MKTFSQFIVEATDQQKAAADRLNQRRQHSKEKSKTAAADFKNRSMDKMLANKQKAAAMKAEYDAKVEADKERREVESARSKERIRRVGANVRRTVKNVVKSGVRRLANRISN